MEIDDNGLEPAISKIINNFNDKLEMNLVFAVRNYLVPRFLNYFNLNKNEIKYLEE